jgi:hypothetical protein
MLDCIQASTYNTTLFVSFLRIFYEKNKCPLCSQLHRMYIHDYVGRLIRDRNTHTNVEIVICVIICPNAKREGKQYTKRMLPPFVIPECNISLENVLCMFNAMPDGSIRYGLASELLGTICERTIRRHYRMARTYIEIATSLLADYLVRMSGVISLPGEPPYEALFVLFTHLSKAVYEAEVKRAGTYRPLPPSTLYVHPVYGFIKRRRPWGGENPLNLFFVIRFYFDSS